jgi:hypothetical protein
MNRFINSFRKESPMSWGRKQSWEYTGHFVWLVIVLVALSVTMIAVHAQALIMCLGVVFVLKLYGDYRLSHRAIEFQARSQRPEISYVSGSPPNWAPPMPDPSFSPTGRWGWDTYANTWVPA